MHDRLNVCLIGFSEITPKHFFFVGGGMEEQLSKGSTVMNYSHSEVSAHLLLCVLNAFDFINETTFLPTQNERVE